MLKKAYLQLEEDGYENGDYEKVLVRINPKSKFKEGFCMSWEDGIMKLTKMGLTASEYNILMVIVSQMEFENMCYVTQSYISKETGIAQPHVSKHITKLVKLKVLFKEDTKQGKALRVNSFFFWKGNGGKAFKMAYLRDCEQLAS